MNLKHLPRAAWLLATVGLVTASGIAAAQSAPASGSQLPPGETVERKTAPATLDLRIGGVLKAPSGADALSLTVEDVTVEGGLAAMESRTRGLVPAPGSVLTLDRIYAFASQLQAAYLESGYPLVRVFVPVQDLDQARARIKVRVVDGSIAEIDAEGVPDRARRPVLALTGSLKGRSSLTAGELERAVLLAGEVAGLTLRSTLMAGRAEGETRLILTAEHRFVQTALSIDDRLTEDLGGEQVTVSMALNGLLRRGDRMGLTLASALSDLSLSADATRRYLGFFADTLVGSSGLAIGADGAISSSRPQGASSFLALRNEYQRWGVSAVYPTVRSRSRTANTRLSLDLSQETQESDLLGFPVTLSRDRTRVLRLSHEEQLRMTRGPFAGSGLGFEMEYSRGLDALGARTAADATTLEPLSRSGADAVFDKLVVGLWAASTLGGTGLVASLELRGQTGFGDPLLRSEQFSAATSTLISGLPSGALVGDRALAGRLQLSRPWEVAGSRIVPYLFGAKARTDLERPTVLEAPQVRVDAFGAGLRGEIALGGGYTAAVGLEWSRTDATQAEFDEDGFAFRVTLRH